MIIDGRPLKRNQLLVFKALMEYSHTTMVLFLSAEGRQRRRNLMAQQHHLRFPETSLLQYHISLLDTLSICAAGKVQSVRVLALSVSVSFSLVASFSSLLAGLRQTIKRTPTPLRRSRCSCRTL